MCHAATKDFGPFFALRFILGMLESCVAPSKSNTIFVTQSLTANSACLDHFHVLQKGGAGKFGWSGFTALTLEGYPNCVVLFHGP